MKKPSQKLEYKIHPLIEILGATASKLLPFEIQVSKVHALGLYRIGDLTVKELNKLLVALKKLAREIHQDEVTLKSKHGDSYMFIEQYLIKNLGSLGKKIHMKGNKHEQTLVALKLYIQSSFTTIHNNLLGNVPKYSDSFPLDKEFTAKALGFQVSPLAKHLNNQKSLESAALELVS